MDKKKTLPMQWDEEFVDEQTDKFTINENFAKKFEYNKRRQLLEQGKIKYGDLLENDNVEEESSESSSEDDSEGELVNSRFEKKFLQVITAIRAGDPSVLTKTGDNQIGEQVWKDEDFEDDTKHETKKEKKYTLKDQIRTDAMKKIEDGASASDSEDSESAVFKKKGRGPTIAEEQRRLKQDFKKLAEQDSGDDLLVKKPRIQDSDDDVPIEKEEKNNHLVTDTELLARFYGSDEKLDPSERFLRNYILNEGWKDKTQMAVFDDPKLKKIDKEDDERLDEMEAYETAYNFRFEDPNAATITSHARNALASETMRRKEETRKLARERKKERKEEEKNRKREEVNQLKQLKREEIIERLKKAEFIAHGGIDTDHLVAEKISKELETEFIPDLYDKTMSKAFNDKYYEKDSDQDVEINPDLNLNLLQDKDFEDSVDGDFETEMAGNLKQKVVETANKRATSEGYHTWYVCDDPECLKPIKEGHFRYDCQQCDNFTFCEKCYRRNTTHTHKFVKSKVPLGQGPPDNNDELIDKAYMRCTVCKLSLIDVNKRVYTCLNKSCSKDPANGEAIYWCKKCKEETEHEHKRERVKGTMGFPFDISQVDKDKMTAEQKQQYLDSLFDEYHQLDFEDVIADGLTTRFKYTNVAKEDYGLTNEEILLLDDKDLNQIVSLKQYRPYRENQFQRVSDAEAQKIQVYKTIQKKKQFKNEIQEQLELVKQVQKASLEEEKAKHLKKKVKKAKHEKMDKKRKRSELTKDQNDETAVEQPEAAAKRKRLALYDN